MHFSGFIALCEMIYFFFFPLFWLITDADVLALIVRKMEQKVGLHCKFSTTKSSCGSESKKWPNSEDKQLHEHGFDLTVRKTLAWTACHTLEKVYRSQLPTLKI